MKMASSRAFITDSEKQAIIADDTISNMTGKRHDQPPRRRTSLVKALIIISLAVAGLYIYLPRLGFLSPLRTCGSTAHNLNNGDDSLGAVASESSICSAAGTEMLKLGGNAADAMVATVFCVGVVGMYHSGIGGGGFMLIRSPDGTFENVDFRETAPAAAHQDMFASDPHLSVVGGLASGVPSEVRGLQYLHNKHGVLPWSAVLQPAIKTARNGFPMTEDLYHATQRTLKDGKDFLVTDPSWAQDFAPHGTVLGLGDTLYRKRYADTLETIANEGPEAFYTGRIAETMIDAVRATNGIMTLEDLQNYEVAIRDTPQIDYRGYTVTSTSAPSAGVIGLSILKIIDGYEQFFSPESIQLSTHRLDEAMRFAYGQRTSFGDPLFVEGMHQHEQDILKDTTVSRIRRRISDLRTQNVSAYDPEGIESRDTPGTSHISAADRSGLAITLTTTINLYFGSHIMVPETGIIMNNEMNDFSIPGSSNEFGYVPSPSNYIQPGKRPLSSITPIIVTHPDGSLYFVTGAAGGSRITTATVQSVVNLIDRDMGPYDALAEPRIHDQLIPNQVRFEYSFNNETVRSMQRRGHNVTWVAPGQSSAQCLRLLRNGTFEAAGEPRQKNSGGFAV